MFHNLEFYVGLFAEENRSDDDSIFGELMTGMVAYDAFTQALTNPLLSKNVFNRETFSAYGFKMIEETNTLQDLVNRNTSGGPYSVSFSVPKGKLRP